jgi:hypothetical protein
MRLRVADAHAIDDWICGAPARKRSPDFRSLRQLDLHGSASYRVSEV